MTNKSLPVIPLSNNDIESLAGLLEDNFQYRSKLIPSHEKEYLENLNLIVGLSLTTFMVRGIFVSTLRSDLDRFCDGFRFSSPQRNSIKPIALEAARIICEAVRHIPTFCNCSEFYIVFRKALMGTIKCGLLDTSKNSELSARLLKAMLKETYYPQSWL